MNRLYSEYSREFGFILKDSTGRLSEIKKQQIRKALMRFNNDLRKTIADQVEAGYKLSDACTDDFVKSYFKGMDISAEQLEKMLAVNTGATGAFVQRAAAGLNLSDRVWKLTQETGKILNTILESGLLKGRSASETATDIKRFLKEPERRFRRVRDETGKLVLSTPAKNYHPGQGVYRSSYKNALRLSRTEINMAYRTNDFERRKKLSFVMGQQISTSGNHPMRDICDELAGRYPKEFKFVGWHPRCRCISNSITIPKEKMKEYLGGAPMDQRHRVKKVPGTALKYLNDNAEQIKGWSNTPYFIRDNFKVTETGFEPKI